MKDSGRNLLGHGHDGRKSGGLERQMGKASGRPYDTCDKHVSDAFQFFTYASSRSQAAFSESDVALMFRNAEGSVDSDQNIIFVMRFDGMQDRA